MERRGSKREVNGGNGRGAHRTLKESSARVGTAGDKDEEAAGARGVRVEVL
jgi:hypothetical protein